MNNLVEIRWDNSEKTIIRYTYQSNWTWDSFLEALTEGRRMMQEVSHSVCILNDMRQIRYLPPNFLSTAQSIITSRPENTGISVFLTTNVSFQAMYRVLAKILKIVPTEYILVKTEEEAYQEIEAWFTKESLIP